MEGRTPQRARTKEEQLTTLGEKQKEAKNRRIHQEQRGSGTGRGPGTGHSIWTVQGPGRGASTTPQGQIPDPTQGPPNIPREERSEALRGIRGKLENEKDKEVRGVMKQRKKIHDLKKYLDESSGGTYRQVNMESLERYKKDCKEREGMVLGFEKAIVIVEMEEEEQDQRMLTPKPIPYPVHPTLGRTPHNRQNTTEGEGLLAGEEEGRDDLSKAQHGRPSTSKGMEEAGGTSKHPPGRAGNGRPSSRKTKIAKEKQEEAPSLAEPQAQGEHSPKEN